MDHLEKIKDVSARYQVATSTLRYYEKMGLLSSSRCKSSGYRLYDEDALVRLRQILVLRKLDISIGDIKKIFGASHADIVLAVLDKKVDDIDGEVALLHELKALVLAFIQQIRAIDFYNETDVKRLFDKAVAETTLVGDGGNLAQLFDTSDQLDGSITAIAVEPIASNGRCNMESFEIIKHEAYKFIGKSVYFRAGTPCGDAWFHDFLFEHSDWMWAKLDEMNAYASDITTKAALLTWDKYCEKTELLGFTYGKFMKADAPVPAGMDYFDIAEGYMGVGVFDNWDEGDHEYMVNEAIEKTGEYTPASWRFMGELLYGEGKYGYFVSCERK
ncbi:MAG: MerR family transcriptional regulator [Defluviitaleaceae bacterium]|nr:MerR family transcriptional regulator [Defluviitaleaceae bacterium]